METLDDLRAAARLFHVFGRDACTGAPIITGVVVAGLMIYVTCRIA